MEAVLVAFWLFVDAKWCFNLKLGAEGWNLLAISRFIFDRGSIFENRDLFLDEPFIGRSVLQPRLRQKEKNEGKLLNRIDMKLTSSGDGQQSGQSCIGVTWRRHRHHYPALLLKWSLCPSIRSKHSSSCPVTGVCFVVAYCYPYYRSYLSDV